MCAHDGVAGGSPTRRPDLGEVQPKHTVVRRRLSSDCGVLRAVGPVPPLVSRPINVAMLGCCSHSWRLLPHPAAPFFHELGGGLGGFLLLLAAATALLLGVVTGAGGVAVASGSGT
eukprot:973628-Rhodomonas_salina.1